ncbi:hypothetical protein F4677DRAFT_179913 [Hypoxylon crocopeplum]|nr:hypothetical protein F4677DRAFT_179913 [Hypoxylon crocopeplum]
MNATKPTTTTVGTSPNVPSARDEWEDWEESDDEAQGASEDKDGLLIDLSDEKGHKSSRTTTQSVSRNTIRHSIQRPVRLKSRGRQKAQNAKAGIRLVTDMSTLRRPVKFVDPAALHALEGKPSSASIGSFSWLKRKPGYISGSRPNLKSARGFSSDLSPASRPIVIGIAVPSDNLSEHQVSPYTAAIETPTDFKKFPQKPTAATENHTAPTPQQLRSVWSPDTEVSESSYSRATSSIYSQPSMYGGPPVDTDVPPVPALPASLQPQQKQVIVFDDPDDDDVGTPCTLFEEDGSPTATRKSAKPKAVMISPESASSRSHGWWDHVTTPFLQQSNPFKQQTQEAGPSSSSQHWGPFKKQVQAEASSSPPPAAPQDWWTGVGEKGAPSKPNPQLILQPILPPIVPSILTEQHGKEVASSSAQSPGVHQDWWGGGDEKRGPVSGVPELTKTEPTPLQQQYTAPSVGTSSRPATSGRSETQAEKAKILLEVNQTHSEEPPPYSPPKPVNVNVVKYGVILPPAHVVSTQRVPSPGPVTPGLPGTMTSQRAISMTDIPLTPSTTRPAPAVVLPDRAPGSYVTGDHFYEARGQSNRTERQRRRYEKEEAVARKVGGFWRGRGCMSSNGCFGRSGREGRKRRRIWLGVIAGIIAAIILAVVLAVVLTRRPPTEQGTPFSIWLNLTDFPPMPTGVLTVAGADNTAAISGCVQLTATTAWSCTLPKEEHDSVAPHDPNQPEFIFQIQYDNNTRALWNITDEKGQTFLADQGFAPDPAPPSVAEIRFLGNTTDHIQADNKAGEPTPFFISLLKSINDTVGPNMLSRRQGPNNAIGSDGGDGLNFTEILPPPTLNGDGTGAPARLFPLPLQQPIRLFDRGLPTEHYGFYTYFDKTIYMVDTVKVNSADENGGALETEAKSIVTFAQTRFLVQVWTRMENETLLLGGNNGAAVPWTNGTDASSTPGTMPYPVTIVEDMHGGDRNKKIDFRYGVDENQQINTTDAQLVLSNRGFAGTLINGMNNDPDLSLGGVDGGTGGCRCEWINFQGLSRVTT